MKLILPLAVGLLCALPLCASEMDTWYGTITIDRKFHRELTEDLKPGKRIETEDHTIQGTIRYLPQKRRLISGSFVHHRSDDRRIEGTKQCMSGKRSASYHNYQIRKEDTSLVDSFSQSAHLSIFIGDDGNYDFFQGFMLNAKLDGMKVVQTTETYDGCTKSPPKRKVESVNIISLMPPTPLRIKGHTQLPTDALQGSDTQTLPGGSEVKITWHFTRAAPKAIAKVTGPTNVTRLDTVVLDGSGSSGKIKEYKWKFDLDSSCTGAPVKIENEMIGPRVSFKALCDFRAHLYVEDELGSGDWDTFWVRVRPRQGEEWKTKFESKPGPDLTTRLTAEAAHFGVNECRHHENRTGTDHKIHTNAENNATWRDDGYVLEQLNDEGPFSGMWYVSEQKLRIERFERINRNLKATGEIFSLNSRHGNQTEAATLLAQVAAHEKAHSDLVKEALDRLGNEGDPAARIEEMIANNEQLMQIMTDFRVREVETILYEASSEELTQNRVRSMGAFEKECKIWLPRGDAESLENLGPFWSIGEK